MKIGVDVRELQRATQPGSVVWWRILSRKRQTSIPTRACFSTATTRRGPISVENEYKFAYWGNPRRSGSIRSPFQ